MGPNPSRFQSEGGKGRRRSGGGVVAEHSGSLRVIIAAIAGNVAIAICKFGAALVTSSAAMYSEAIHSTVDTGNELLLLFGMRRAEKPPDAEHPFGYGLQLYFWVFVFAVMIFGLGALVAFYEGVEKILHAEPARYVVVNYIVLGASIVFEAGSWFVASREFRHQRGRLGWLEAVRRSKDPTVFTVLFEDSAALIGLVIALMASRLPKYSRCHASTVSPRWGSAWCWRRLQRSSHMKVRASSPARQCTRRCAPRSASISTTDAAPPMSRRQSPVSSARSTGRPGLISRPQFHVEQRSV